MATSVFLIEIWQPGLNKVSGTDWAQMNKQAKLVDLIKTKSLQRPGSPIRLTSVIFRQLFNND